jgi:hypothetical protein
MKTDIQLKAEIHTALSTDATLISLVGDRINWFAPLVKAYPCITYSMLDTVSEYVLGGCVILSHEYSDFQIDVWATFGQMDKMSDIVARVKTLMTGLGYMAIPGQAELLDGDTVQKIMRWRVANV